MSTSDYQKAAETAKTPEHWSKAARKRVLIVEDDRLSLKVLRQLLGARGYNVLQASGGWDAISRARQEQPDLILMDLKLPDISGLDATRLLKMDDQTKNIPIIAVTAFVTPSFEATAFENGCDAYIAKPINIENLLRTVESFCLVSRSTEGRPHQSATRAPAGPCEHKRAIDDAILSRGA